MYGASYYQHGYWADNKINDSIYSMKEASHFVVSARNVLCSLLVIANNMSASIETSD